MTLCLSSTCYCFGLFCLLRCLRGDDDSDDDDDDDDRKRYETSSRRNDYSHTDYFE
jgi:hypothetical protein